MNDENNINLEERFSFDEIVDYNYFIGNNVNVELLLKHFRLLCVHLLNDNENFYFTRELNKKTGEYYLIKLNEKNFLKKINKYFIYNINSNKKYNLKDLYLQYISKRKEIIFDRYKLYSNEKDIFSVIQLYFMDVQYPINLESKIINKFMNYLSQFPEILKLIIILINDPNYIYDKYIIISGKNKFYKIFKNFLYHIFSSYCSFDKKNINLKVLLITKENNKKNMENLSNKINCIFYVGKIPNGCINYNINIKYEYDEKLFNENFNKLDFKSYAILFKFLKNYSFNM